MLKTLSPQTQSCSDHQHVPLMPWEVLDGGGFPIDQSDVADAVVFGAVGSGKSSGYAGTLALFHLNAAFGRSQTATKDERDQADVSAQGRRFLS